MRLIDTTDVAADAPFILGPLTDSDEVLVAGGLIHEPGCQDCPDDGAHHMTRGHARLRHLRVHACFPQGRAA